MALSFVSYIGERVQRSDLSKPGRENWVADSEVNECTGCSESFTVFRRKHHCRGCGDIFCSKCCSERVEVHRPHYDMDQVKVKRVCKDCCKFGREDSEASTTDSVTTLCDLVPASVMTIVPSLADAEFADELDMRDLSGPVWNALCRSQLRLADAIRSCAKCSASSTEFENESENALNELRCSIRLCPRDVQPGANEEALVVLGNVPGKVHVWRFLELMHEKRKLHRRRVDEVTAILETSPSWHQAKPVWQYC